MVNEAVNILINEYGFNDDNFIEAVHHRDAFSKEYFDIVDGMLISESALESLFLFNSELKNYVKVITLQVEHNPMINLGDATKSTLSDSNFAIMITGIDERIDPNENGRNDVNLVVAIDTKNNKLTMVSLPRDSMVKNTCNQSVGDKLTHIGMNSGADCVRMSVSNYFDIPIDYYIQVSFSSFVAFIDMIGGIDVNVPKSLTLDDSFRDSNNMITISEGIQHLSGEETLVLSRNRKSIVGGDFARVMNHQLILNSIIEKISKNPLVLLTTHSIYKHGDFSSHNFTWDDISLIYDLLMLAIDDEIIIDNYFVRVMENPNEEYTHYYLPIYSSLEIAKMKLKTTLGLEELDENYKYYDEVINNNKTNGSSDFKY